MTFTDSEVVIGVFQAIGKTIKSITRLIDFLPTAIPIFTTLGVLAFNAVGHKLRELKLAKEIHEVEQSRKILSEEADIKKAKKDIETYKTNIATDPSNNEN